VPHRAKGLCKTCYDRMRHPSHIPRGSRGRFPELTREFLVQRYLDAGLSSVDIARDLGCSRVHVLDRLRRWGIPIRSLSAARLRALELGKIEGQRRVTTDPAFFDTWSPAMAYVLGLLATDGCLTPPKIHPRTGYQAAGNVSLTQRDTEVLEKVQQLMGGTSRTYARSGTAGGTVHMTRIGGPRTYERLVQLGLTPRKSRTLRFPDVPVELRRHFVRGCWDGDGSIFVERGSGRLKASFVTASKEFAESLVTELRAAGLPVPRLYVETRGVDREVYQLKLSRELDVVALCRWMYDGVSEVERLSRKYETYRRAVGVGAEASGAAGDGEGVELPRARGNPERGRAILGQPSGPTR
jgi:LAGLIDADG DNA endonuclease family protein